MATDSIANCGLYNLTCTVSAAREGRGDPIKPAYYIDAWATLGIMIVAFIIGRISVRRK